MKAKLIKTKTGFYLWRNPLDKLQELLGATVPIMNDNGVDLREYKLSLKNCQAIERGYDLDELAEEATEKQLIRILGGEDKEEVLDDIQKRKFYFIEGAKAILEILGDKKFSEEDIRNAWNASLIQYFEFYEHPTTARRELYIQSLQQDEWDVEIVTKPFVTVGSIIADFSEDTPVDILNVKKEVVEEGYALDADGCLILKLKL